MPDWQLAFCISANRQCRPRPSIASSSSRGAIHGVTFPRDGRRLICAYVQSPLCACSSNHYFGRASQSAARRSCTQLCCSLETGVPPGSWSTICRPDTEPGLVVPGLPFLMPEPQVGLIDVPHSLCRCRTFPTLLPFNIVSRP